MTEDQKKPSKKPYSEQVSEDEDEQQQPPDPGVDAPTVITRTMPVEAGSPAPILTELFYCDFNGVWHGNKTCCGQVRNTTTSMPPDAPVCPSC